MPSLTIKDVPAPLWARLRQRAIALARSAGLVTGNRRHDERIPELCIEDWIRGPDLI